MERKIIHVDMDCYFAAVEVLANPELKGKPIAVGGRPEERGVIATASYEARKFGVRSAQASFKALQLCPQLIIVPPQFALYKKTTEHIRKIFAEYTNLIEPLSLDEAYLDVTHSPLHSGSATLIAQEIRQRIYQHTSLTASAGIAPNKFLAKVASDWNKPNGQKTISPKEVSSLIKTLPVNKIYGVGKVTAERLEKLGVFTCGQLQNLSLHKLNEHFGKFGHTLFDLCRGIDHRPVETDSERKSLSVENTYAKDLMTLESCLAALPELEQDLCRRWSKISQEYQITALFLKIKFSDFTQTTIERARWTEINTQHLSILMKQAFERRSIPVRLIGIGVRLEPGRMQQPQQLEFPNLDIVED